MKANSWPQAFLLSLALSLCWYLNCVIYNRAGRYTAVIFRTEVNLCCSLSEVSSVIKSEWRMRRKCITHQSTPCSSLRMVKITSRDIKEPLKVGLPSKYGLKLTLTSANL